MRTFQAHVYLEENDSNMLICCNFMIEGSTRIQANNNIAMFVEDIKNLKRYHYKSYYLEEYKDGKVFIVSNTNN